MRYLLFFISFFSFSGFIFTSFSSCAYFHNLSSGLSREPNQVFQGLEFKNEQVIDAFLKIKGLAVGGLSGFAYDSSSDSFYVLSDDKKNHRLYRMVLKTEPHYHLEIVEMILLKEADKSLLKRNMDPEELVFYNQDLVFITSEGQQVFEEHEPTQIFTYGLPDFHLKEAWPVPEVFWTPGQRKQTKKLGQQSNKGFEALALDKKSDQLWTVTEMPLFQDLKEREDLVLRLSAFDIPSQQLLSQFLYPIETHTGVTAMFFLDDKKFLTLERTFNEWSFTINLFITNCKKAEDVKDQIYLQKKSYPLCSKQKIWSSEELDFLVDNLEGMSLVPIKNSNKKLLILISDNNFKGIQKNQILFFELSPSFPH